jgi:hypothetical protein
VRRSPFQRGHCLPSSRHTVVIFLVASFALALVACETGGRGASRARSCVGPLGPPIRNLDSLPICCVADGGHGHCLNRQRIPDLAQPFLRDCDGRSMCVPDRFLANGGNEPPPTCTAFGGPGVCLSTCVPQVAENAAILPVDSCTGGELCVPCVHPTTHKPTGACRLAELTGCTADEQQQSSPGSAPCHDPRSCEYEAHCPPVIDVTRLRPCTPDAHCVEAAVLRSAGQSAIERLAHCPGSDLYCVPDLFLRTGGKFLVKTCRSLYGNEGRCMSLALPRVAETASRLPRDSCAETERCAPCTNPVDGNATIACKLSCDRGPTEPPRLFAMCCENRGRCVPSDLVPVQSRVHVRPRSCDQVASGLLCVPLEQLEPSQYPVSTCEARTLLAGSYRGVCLSNCLEFGWDSLGLGRGSCSDGYRCVPCVHDGKPTGAPGC